MVRIKILFVSLFLYGSLSAHAQTKVTVNRSILGVPHTIQLAEIYLDSNKVSEATWILINTLEQDPVQAEGLAKRIKASKTDQEFIQWAEDVFWAYILHIDLISNNGKNRVFEDYFFLENELIAFGTQHGKQALQLDQQAQQQMAQGKRTEAVQSYTAAIQLIPTARRYYRRAQLYEVLDESILALRDYDSSILLQPYPAHYFSRGELYMGLRSLDAAIRDFSAVIDSQFDYLLQGAYLNRAKCYALKGEINSDQKSLELSIPDFTKAIELFPTADAYKRRGVVYYGVKKIEIGKKDFMRAIELDPNDAQCYFFLGFYEDDFKKSIALLDKCIELIRDDRETPTLRRNAIGLRGIIYYNNGKKKQACADFQQAMELGDKESEEYYNNHCRKRK